MKKMLFIMNPFAGMRRANRFLADILTIFNRAGYQVITHMTSGTGNATQIVREMAHEVDVVVCCGGDGTFSETTSGIIQSGADTPVGYIPAGSTNDYAASLRLPTGILEAAQEVVDGTPVSYDMGKFGDRHFVYVASFGAFTKTSYATPQNVKNVLGHVAYLLEGIQELSQIRKYHVRMELDDQVIEDDFLFGAIGNSTSYAGIVSLDPRQVDLQDGQFEVLLVRAPKNLAEITECLQAVQLQKYNDCAMLTFCSTSKVRVFASADMPWTLDGEKEDGHEEVFVENLHRSIRLIRKAVDA